MKGKGRCQETDDLAHYRCILSRRHEGMHQALVYHPEIKAYAVVHWAAPLRTKPWGKEGGLRANNSR